MKCLRLLLPLLIAAALGVGCDNASRCDAPDGAVADLAALPADAALAPFDFATPADLLCRMPCGSGGFCPAATWGVCESGCCVCRPPDGGTCPANLWDSSEMSSSFTAAGLPAIGSRLRSERD